MHIRIGTRTSDLARIQALEVGSALLAKKPGLAVEYVLKKAEGDKDLKTPLYKLPDKGVFTRDLTDLLISGEIDLAVHSWKDLPLLDAGETAVVGTLPRADMRDVVLFRKDCWERVCKTACLTVLSSSPRRAYNLSQFLPWALPASVKTIDFISVRGNVQTRVRKLFEEDADALVVAKAALDRMIVNDGTEFAESRQTIKRWLADCRWIVTPLSENPCAPAQGALAIEALRSRKDIIDLIALVDQPADRAAVEIERKTLQGYGGGCHQKIGMAVVDRPWGRVSFLRGITNNGEVLSRRAFEGRSPRPPRTAQTSIWPLTANERIFNESVPIAEVSLPKNAAAFWIARDSALPPGLEIPDGAICWAAGLDTWRKLAARGIWINGCAESMGEAERPDLSALAPSGTRWFKLSHSGAPPGSGMELIATYELIPSPNMPNLCGKTNFFWRSGSQFETVLRDNPHIRQGWHSCGPGNTYKKIVELLGSADRVSVCLDHQSWLKEVSG